MLAGAALGGVVTALPLAALVAIGRATGTAKIDVDFPIALGAIVVAAALAAIARGVSAAMARPLVDYVDYERKSRAAPPTAERPFGERLAQYLSEEPTPAVGTGSRRRMAFFLAFLPGRRSAPKSPGYIREILWRIHRLLRSNRKA